MSDIHNTLRQYWGYDAFRPRQEQVIRSLIDGHDVAVVMPTGGGKSLCYQLPAVVLGRTAVVVSPLISLMQDQAAQLAEMGIPAAVLNSSMSWDEQKQVLARAKKGEYRLLYLSPERLARADSVAWLAQVPLAYFVIDEAHCISEWGHEFRPEYRQLSGLRERFPGLPIAAFTASATRRVRSDIVQQLRLRDADKHVLSFHRPNLRYMIRQCKGKEQETFLLRALKAVPTGSVIVYARTIAQVTATADMLNRRGIPAIAYHGKLDTAERQQNQESWMSDEFRVLVGTVAFGLGINKPSVRAVIHLGLPGSVEQYYQEAGRAGRDGLPAECTLLWQKKDAGILAHFIEEIDDADEKRRAWQRYREVRGFAESRECRHRRICEHFGETPKWEECGMCDVCCGFGAMSGAAAAGGAGGAGGALAADAAAGDTGTVAADGALFGVPDNAAGDASGGRPTPTPRRTPPPVAMPLPEPVEHPELRERLRAWRSTRAKQNKVPAYVVMNDATLDDLCRRHPTTLGGLLDVSGIGARRAELYGEEILAVIRQSAVQ